MSITIKNLKTGPSREWGPDGSFTCTVYFQGIKVGVYFESGAGGCPVWERLFNESAFESMIKHIDELALANNPDYEICTMPRSYICGKVQTGICEAVDLFENNKIFKKHCKTKTLYMNDQGEIYTLRNAYTTEVKEYIQSNVSDLVEIINERFTPLAG